MNMYGPEPPRDSTRTHPDSDMMDPGEIEPSATFHRNDCSQQLNLYSLLTYVYSRMPAGAAVFEDSLEEDVRILWYFMEGKMLFEDSCSKQCVERRKKDF